MKKILKVLFILIGLGLIGTSIYMYTNKVEKDEPKKEEKEEKKEEKEEKKEEEKEEEEKEEESESSQPEETVNYKFADVTDSLDSISFGDKTYKLTTTNGVTLDGKKLFDTDALVTVDKVFQYGDKLLIVTQGTDVRTNKIHIYDLNGTLVKEIYEIDTDSMVIGIKGLGDLDYVLHDDYIEFGATRLTHGPAYAKTGADICTGNVDGSAVASARYKMNGKFEFEVISGTEKTIADTKKDAC